MSNTAPDYAALNSASAAEWAARREESIKRISAALAEGALTIADIAEEFGMPTSTAYGHLTYMESLGLAHRTGKRDENRRRLWANGPKPVEAEQEEPEERASRAVPAQQLGMARDPLVEALFGPAKHGTAA